MSSRIWSTGSPQEALGEEPLVFLLSMFWLQCCLWPALPEVVVVAAEVLVPQHSPEALWPKPYSPVVLTTTVYSDGFEDCCFLMPTVQFNWSSLGSLISHMQWKIKIYSNCTQNWAGSLCLSGKTRKLIKSRQTRMKEIIKKHSLFLDNMNI